MKKILRGITQIVLAITKALHFIWEALCVVTIVGCIVILAILALIAEVGERLFRFVSSTLTALVERLGNKLMKEKT